MPLASLLQTLPQLWVTASRCTFKTTRASRRIKRTPCKSKQTGAPKLGMDNNQIAKSPLGDFVLLSDINDVELLGVGRTHNDRHERTGRRFREICRTKNLSPHHCEPRRKRKQLRRRTAQLLMGGYGVISGRRLNDFDLHISNSP